MSKDIATSAMEAYERLVDRLQKQIDKLESDNAHLRTDNEFLRSEVARLNAEKRMEIDKLAPSAPKWPWQEHTWPQLPQDRDAKPIRWIGTAPLPDDIRPNSLPDDFSIRPRPWYENPDYRLNSPDGPYVGAGKITCSVGGADA